MSRRPCSILRAARRGRGRPLLFAHAERSRAFQADDGLARDLVARGARLQVNANSIRSGSGDRGRLAWHLLESGLVSIVASDSHALGLRPPRLAEAADELARRLDEDAVHTLTYTNPTAPAIGTTHPRSSPPRRHGAEPGCAAQEAMSLQTSYREPATMAGRRPQTSGDGDAPIPDEQVASASWPRCSGSAR